MKNNLIEEVCSTLYRLTRQLSRITSDTYAIVFAISNAPVTESTVITVAVDTGEDVRNFKIAVWNHSPEFRNVVYKEEYDKCVDYLKIEITKLSEGKEHD